MADKPARIQKTIRLNPHDAAILAALKRLWDTSERAVITRLLKEAEQREGLKLPEQQ